MNKNKDKNNFRKGNSRSNTRGKRRGKEIEIDVPEKRINKEELSTNNDYSWYTKYPGLFSNVTGINTGTQVGSQLNWDPSALTPSSVFLNATAAGMCVIHYIPTMGSADAVLTSPANKVGSQMYAVMRQELGSTAQYDATDIMLYLGGMQSAFMLYALGAKIYGMLRMASPFNNYFLENIAEAHSVDFNSFSTNLSNFRSTLNQYAIFLSSRQVPAEFSIYLRHMWLLSNMFTDSDTAKAQIYSFMPDGYYTYVENSGGPGYLKFNKMPYAIDVNTKLTFNDWKTMINNVYESMMGSSDIDQMSADIWKAFKGNTFVLSTINEDFVIPIVYSQEVLMQIENIMLLGYPAELSYTVGNNTYKSWDIYQTTALPTSPRLIQHGDCSLNLNATPTQTQYDNLNKLFAARKLVNFHKSEIPKEDVIVATRGIPGYVTLPATLPTSAVISPTAARYGTEVYTRAVLVDMNSTYTIQRTVYQYCTPDRGNSQQIASLWSQFDWAPTYFQINSGMNAFAFMCDIDMSAMIDW